jgi:hypothetical protein
MDQWSQWNIAYAEVLSQFQNPSVSASEKLDVERGLAAQWKEICQRRYDQTLLTGMVNV